MLEAETTEVTVELDSSPIKCDEEGSSSLGLFRKNTEAKRTPRRSFLKRQSSSPISYVLFTYFDHTKGPTVKSIFPSILEGDTSEEFVSLVDHLLPFKTLPEKARSIADSEEVVHGHGDLQQSADGGAQFVLNCPDVGPFFGVSQFVQIKDTESERGTCQGSLVVLATAPIQGFLLHRIRTMTPVLLEEEGIGVVLETVFCSLSQMNTSDINMALVFQDLPISQLATQLGSALFSVVKLLLLEGRIMFYSRDVSRASSACLALVGLLPGLLPLGVRKGEAWAEGFGVKAYRWRKFGLPLEIFDSTYLLEPVTVMADTPSLFAQRGFVSGTANEMIPTIPSARLDCFIDLDQCVVKLGRDSTKARACVPPSVKEQVIIGKLLSTLGKQPSSEEKSYSTVWEGSPLWIAEHFQQWLEELLQTAAACIEHQRLMNRSKRSSNMGISGSISSLMKFSSSSTPSPHSLDAALIEYNKNWAKLWEQTTNFRIWKTKVPPELGKSRGTRKKSKKHPPSSGVHEYTYPNGDVYKGAFSGRKRNGHGTYLQASTGNAYSGGWQNDQRFGQGKLVTGSKDFTFEGTWENNCPHGQGTATFSNGEKYVGNWFNGKYHGDGKLTLGSGSSYDGDFQEGKRHGAGIATEPDGEVYTGEWKDDRRHGVGQCVYSDKSIYSGEWVQGMRHGEGVLLLPNGAKYEGGWANGQKHGLGRRTSTTGTREGQWERDKEVNGEWRIDYPNKDHYSGQCKSSLPHGQGVCKYADGGVYTGLWEEGQRSGPGMWVGPNGETREGLWRKDQLEVWQSSSEFQAPEPGSNKDLVPVSLDFLELDHEKTSREISLSVSLNGWQAIEYPNGDKYTGDFSRGRRHGKGTYIEYKTRNSYEGDWVRGKRHGKGKITSGQGVYTYEGDWEHDKRTGSGTCVIRGKESFTGTFRDGMFHGKGTFKDFDGNEYEGEWVDGQKQGMGTQRHVAAGWTYTGEWRAGQRHGIGNCTFKDKSVYSGQWKRDSMDGEGVLVKEDGEKYEGLWKEGKRHGHGLLSLASGTRKEGEWENDRPKGCGDWQITFEDGSNFVGECLEGLPHGTGVCKYKNGDVYTGEWSNGQRSGKGLCIFSNGESFDGLWSNDHIAHSGKGTLTLTDGTVHEYT